MIDNPAVSVGIAIFLIVFLIGALLDFTWSIVRVVYFGARLTFLCLAYLMLIAALAAVKFLEKGMRK